MNATDFVKAYKSGKTLLVTFNKADGSLRTMVVERNPLIENAEVKGVRRHSENVLPVIERLWDGTHQWRSIRLDRLVSANMI